MHNERRRGKRPGAAIEYLRRTWSGAAGDDLSTTMKYIRGAADIGLGNTINYLRQKTSSVAENGQAPRSSTFAAPRTSAWATRSTTCDEKRAASRKTAGRNDRVPATHKERRRWRRPGHHDLIPSRRRGHRPG